MKLQIKIQGMSCAHCQKRVENALKSLGDIDVKVDLENGTATIGTDDYISDEIIREAIDDLGFTVTEIIRKNN